MTSRYDPVGLGLYRNIVVDEKGRENPNAAIPPHWGHTNVPWAPGTCNVIGRQIVWVAVFGFFPSLYHAFGGGRMTASPIQNVSEVIL